jgi:hypothetical protein
MAAATPAQTVIQASDTPGAHATTTRTSALLPASERRIRWRQALKSPPTGPPQPSAANATGCCD